MAASPRPRLLAGLSATLIALGGAVVPAVGASALETGGVPAACLTAVTARPLAAVGAERLELRAAAWELVRAGAVDTDAVATGPAADVDALTGALLVLDDAGLAELTALVEGELAAAQADLVWIVRTQDDARDLLALPLEERATAVVERRAGAKPEVEAVPAERLLAWTEALAAEDLPADGDLLLVGAAAADRLFAAAQPESLRDRLSAEEGLTHELRDLLGDDVASGSAGALDACVLEAGSADEADAAIDEALVSEGTATPASLPVRAAVAGLVGEADALRLDEEAVAALHRTSTALLLDDAWLAAHGRDDLDTAGLAEALEACLAEMEGDASVREAAEDLARAAGADVAELLADATAAAREALAGGEDPESAVAVVVEAWVREHPAPAPTGTPTEETPVGEPSEETPLEEQVEEPVTAPTSPQGAGTPVAPVTPAPTGPRTTTTTTTTTTTPVGPAPEPIVPDAGVLAASQPVDGPAMETASSAVPANEIDWTAFSIMGAGTAALYLLLYLGNQMRRRPATKAVPTTA